MMNTSAPARFRYNVGFQFKILRVLYQDPSFAATVAPHLDPDLWELKQHKFIARQVLRYVEKYSGGITTDALENAMERAVEHRKFRGDEIDALVSAYAKLDRPVKDRSYIRDETREFIRAAKLKEALLTASEAYDSGDLVTADKALDEYRLLRDAPDGLGHFYLRDAKKRRLRRKRWTANGIPTGTDVDKFLVPGGLPPKQLGCVIAPPGRGKTMTLIHFSKSAIFAGCCVLYVSLELSEDVITDRFDAAISDVYIAQLKSAGWDVKRAMRNLKRKFNEALVVKEFTPHTMTVANLRSYLRQLEQVGFYPDLICVDYADLLEPSRHYQDAYDELGRIYVDLRALAKEENVAIWTASQGNRGSVNAEVVDLAAMADSFKKAAVSDLVIGFSQTPKEKERKRARLYVAKNRNGASDFEVPIRTKPGKQQLLRHSAPDEHKKLKKAA